MPGLEIFSESRCRDLVRDLTIICTAGDGYIFCFGSISTLPNCSFIQISEKIKVEQESMTCLRVLSMSTEKHIQVQQENKA